MKQSLRFQSEEEFQTFFSQLCTAELPEFYPIEGSGGDMGFDGINGTTAYQVYFPEEKNRSLKKYTAKIDEDLTKSISNSKKLDLNITEWVFVVPDDLRIEVVAHLIRKSEETSIKCYYWGATKLTALITKYPYLQDSFPLIFLPPVRDGIKEISDKISQNSTAKVLGTIEIISDSSYKKQNNEFLSEYDKKTNPTHPTNIDSIIGIDQFQEATKKYVNDVQDLVSRKKASDRAYEMDLEELNEKFDEEVLQTNNEMARRGLGSSGIRENALDKIETRRKREQERLRLKYGKTESGPLWIP